MIVANGFHQLFAASERGVVTDKSLFLFPRSDIAVIREERPSVPQHSVQRNVLNIFIDSVMYGSQLPISGRAQGVEEGRLLHPLLFVWWEATVGNSPDF